jgi:type II secretory pathway pseudopilin PulG
MDHKYLTKKDGFTLLELLLYISITSIILLVIIGLLYQIIQGQIKNRTVREVEQQGTEITEIITYYIRNSTGVQEPTPGNTSDQLILNMDDPAVDPVQFSSDGQNVTIQKAGDPAIPLSNSRLTVPTFNFDNLGTTNNDSIKINMTLEHKNPEGGQEYEYIQDFTNTADPRSQ